MKLRRVQMTAGFFFAAFLIFFIYKVPVYGADAPELLSLYVQDTDGEYDTARITFDPGRASTCYIYRKVKGGSFSLIGKLQSSGDLTSFTDKKLPEKGEYIYTVRSRTIGLGGSVLSGYDHEGISTIRGRSTVKADITNLHAKLSWTPNENAGSYAIYRKTENGRWHYVDTVGKDRTTYIDYYSETFNGYEKKNILLNNCYLDTSSHTLSYTVRAVRRYSDFNKRSYSPYYPDGYFNLNAPVIISAYANQDDSVTITFSSVPYARHYLISSCRKNSDGSYRHTVVTSTHQTKEAYIDCDFVPLKGCDYFTVTAVGTRNGKQVEASSLDGFTMKNRNFYYKKILYIGDSITFGSPYKTDINRYIFSYPWRISELTNAQYYNAAIPGATMAFKATTSAPFHRYRIISDVVPEIKMGTTPIASPGLLEINTHTFEDFDTIVICAGTNDYTDLISLGTSDSDNESTYCGALNRLMETIRQADRKRLREGKGHITVIMPDLFYSDRCTSFTRRMSRYSTKNAIGYTLKAYNDAKNHIVKKYKKRGLKVYRFKTSKYVNRKNCAYATADNLHMTKYTYEKLGNDLAAFIMKDWYSSSK